MKTISRAVLFLLLFLNLQSTAHAMFTMTAAPRRGGQSIRFDASGPGHILRNEEVVLSVITDRTVQYYVHQAVYEPLTNEKGQTIPQTNFVMFSPSDATLGTLTTGLETPVTMGRVPIYTSNAAGESDEFLLVYNVHVPQDQPGGTYRSRVSYILEPVQPASGASPVTVNLDVRVDIHSTFRVAIQSVSGGRQLDMGSVSKERPSAEGILKIEIESNIGSAYRVIQQLGEPIASSAGQILEEENIMVTLEGSAPVSLNTAPQVLYTSDENGSGGVLEAHYAFNNSDAARAGIYTGMLVFKVEAINSSILPEIIQIPVRITIESIFYLDVNMGQQGSGLHFGTFASDIESQEQKVQITAHSNLGQPYQVLQVVSRRLVSTEGNALPQESLTFYGTQAKTGTLAVMTPTPVKEGQNVVFTSNSAGDPESFELMYELKVPRDARGGSYSSDLNYTITTL